MTAGNASEGSEQPLNVLQSELETCRSDVEKMRERLRMTEEECGRVRLTKKIDNREKKPTNSELKPMRVRSPC